MPIFSWPTLGVRCLLDTGAEGTVVSRSWWERQKKTSWPCTCRLSTVGGPCTGLSEGELSLEELKPGAGVIRVHVVPLATKRYEIILGGDALGRLQASLRCQDERWRGWFGAQEIDVSSAAVRAKPGMTCVMSSQVTGDKWGQLKVQALREADSVFHVEGERLSATGHAEHAIRLTRDVVVAEKQRRYPHRLVPIIEGEIEKLLREGIIRRSISDFCSPIWMVPKKVELGQEPKYRMVVDFRRLNQYTVTETHPMPRLEDILDRASGARVFSMIDLHAGYHQVRMRATDMRMTAFKFGRGNYEFTRMPFGLKNAPASFQRLMDEAFEGLGDSYVQTFMDDILVYSRTAEDHVEHLKTVFGRLRKFRLKANREKTKLFLPQVRFLGHILDEKGARPDPEKVAAIQGVGYPQTPRQVRKFLGALGFYRRFVPNMAGATIALTNALKKGHKFFCTAEMQAEVDEAKRVLASGLVLQYPDLNRPFLLTTDASSYALGAVLSQNTGDGERPVAYASKKLTEAETRYSTTEREFLAIVWAVEHFRPYLYGTQFIVRTDHQPLTWEAGLKETSARVTRWKARLAPYNFTVKYLKGTENGLADLLSRDVPEYCVNAEELPERLDQPPPAQDGPYEGREVTWSEAIINRHRNQFILVGHGLILQSYSHRYGPQRVVTLAGVAAAPAAELRRLITQLTTQDEMWYVYGVSAAIRAKFATAVRGEWEAPPPELVGCLQRVQTIESRREQERIIRDYHEGETNHRGVAETVDKLSRRYFWLGMRRVVARVLKSCRTCKICKVDRRRLRPVQQETSTPDRPSEIMETDIYIFDGQKYVTVIDRLTKEAWAWPVPDKTAVSVERALRRCFSIVEPPNQLVMDKGCEFRNVLVMTLLELWDIRPHWTTTGHPESHGTIERVHATLGEHLLLLRQDQNLTGPEAMERALHAYNRSIHSSHGMTPWEARRAADGVIAGRLRALKHERTTSLNRGCKAVPVCAGDIVYRRLYTRRLKTDPRYVGPYEVSAILPRCRVRLWKIGTPPHRTEVAHLREVRRGRRDLVAV